MYNERTNRVERVMNRKSNLRNKIMCIGDILNRGDDRFNCEIIYEHRTYT